jgi:hypothetical protein
MPGRPPKPTNTLRGTVDGIAFKKSVTEKMKDFNNLRAAQKAKQESLEAESKRLIAENTSKDNEEILSLQMTKGGKPRKSRRHPRRSRKNKQSRIRRQRHP